MYPPVNIQKALEMECVPKGKAWVLHIYVSLPYTLGYVYIYIHAWNTTTTEYGVISGLFERKRGVKTRVEFRLQPHVFLNKEPPKPGLDHHVPSGFSHLGFHVKIRVQLPIF